MPGESPEIKGNVELEEKWRDARSRSVMIGMIIGDPRKQVSMFGGEFDFGEEVYQCAESLYKPNASVRPENVVKLATLSGSRQSEQGQGGSG